MGKRKDWDVHYAYQGCYITIYKPIAGWKAVLMSNEGPVQTGYFAFKTKEEAIEDAKYWSEADEIPYKEMTI